MPDVFPREAPEPGAVLGYDGADFRVPAVDPAGHLQADVLSSGLPAGAATQATLASILTELQTRNLNRLVSLWHYEGSASGGAGDVSVYSPALGGNYILVVLNAYCFISAGSAWALQMGVNDGAAEGEAVRRVGVALQQELQLPNPVVLFDGDSFWWRAQAVGAGTVLFGRGVGYYARVGV